MNITDQLETSPFPFLFGGTFIEGANAQVESVSSNKFPFLFGGTFIEGIDDVKAHPDKYAGISLPFRRDFH